MHLSLYFALPIGTSRQPGQRAYLACRARSRRCASPRGICTRCILPRLSRVRLFAFPCSIRLLNLQRFRAQESPHLRKTPQRFRVSPDCGSSRASGGALMVQSFAFCTRCGAGTPPQAGVHQHKRVLPSGKAPASQAGIRGFESRHPLHPQTRTPPQGGVFAFITR